ncbi:MAG TPA: hypothetical protein GXX17_02225 [Clostridiales bacterium]|nr:hypothetical protein [Clostridiales bacterium]
MANNQVPSLDMVLKYEEGYTFDKKYRSMWLSQLIFSIIPSKMEALFK